MQKDKSGDDPIWISIVVVSVGAMQFSESCIGDLSSWRGSDMYCSIHLMYHLSSCNSNRYRIVMSVATRNRFWFFSVKEKAVFCACTGAPFRNSTLMYISYIISIY